MILWRFETGDFVQSSPTVHKNAVLFGSDDGYLYSVDQRTGELKWKFNANESIFSSPAIHRGVVYFGAGKNIHGLDVDDGRLVWSFNTTDVVYSSPQIFNETLYTTSYDGWIYAFALDS